LALEPTPPEQAPGEVGGRAVACNALSEGADLAREFEWGAAASQGTARVAVSRCAFKARALRWRRAKPAPRWEAGPAPGWPMPGWWVATRAAAAHHLTIW